MADVIKFRCKACDKKITVRAEYAGKKAKCPACKTPLRVPSPRPKRSATGAPVAVAAGGSSSDPSASNISLAELAAMEANATAELKELSPKAASQPASMRIQGGKECPSCGASSKQDAVICVYCGHNFDSGKQLKTKKDSKMGNAMRSVAASLGEEDHEDTNDFWKYAAPTIGFFAVGLLCFTGVAGMITEGIPLEAAESINGLYNDMGPVGSGAMFSAFGALSGGIWWFMKR